MAADGTSNRIYQIESVLTPNWQPTWSRKIPTVSHTAPFVPHGKHSPQSHGKDLAWKKGLSEVKFEGGVGHGARLRAYPPAHPNPHLHLPPSSSTCCIPFHTVQAHLNIDLHLRTQANAGTAQAAKGRMRMHPHAPPLSGKAR